MGLLIDIIILLVAAIAFAVINAIALAGGLWILFKKMGEAEDPDAFDFSGADKGRVQEFIIRTMIHGAVPAAGVAFIGYILNQMGSTFATPNAKTALAVILFLVQLAGTFFMAFPMQKIDRVRAALLLPFTALTFIIYYPLAISGLIR